MEAFKIIFLVTDSNGNKTTISNKSFAATGWEATEKSRRYIQKTRNYKSVNFIKWKVLNPFQVHFK